MCHLCVCNDAATYTKSRCAVNTHGHTDSNAGRINVSFEVAIQRWTFYNQLSVLFSLLSRVCCSLVIHFYVCTSSPITLVNITLKVGIARHKQGKRQKNGLRNHAKTPHRTISGTLILPAEVPCTGFASEYRQFNLKNIP